MEGNEEGPSEERTRLRRQYRRIVNEITAHQRERINPPPSGVPRPPANAPSTSSGMLTYCIISVCILLLVCTSKLSYLWFPVYVSIVSKLEATVTKLTLRCSCQSEIR